jgi:CheY-like chemotaxis protein
VDLEETEVRKSALIVDDSRSARVVLKRMLEVHELDVDTAESAESALEYLNDHRPDVIFMDHMMPGMDGFEAVTAIKNNPDTATIPIMMYTSQEGELYVGQARALGAVGVLPKAVEPVEVSKVLASLHVIGERVEREKQAARSDGHDATRPLPPTDTLDRGIRELIQDLFDQQRAVIRRDLLDSYEAIAARVADEIRVPEADERPGEKAGRAAEMPARFLLVIAVMAVVVIVFAWLYWQREQGWQQVRQQNATLLAALEQQRSIEADGAIEVQRRLTTYQRSLGSSFSTALDAVEWAINRSGHYAFGELPLGDERLALVEELSSRLIGLGFSGEVLVETHVGDFCMMDGGADGFELAAPEMRAANCAKIGFENSEAEQLGLRQSVAFANFVNVAEERTDGQIRYQIASRGNTQPLLAYPASSDVTAGSWNEIALANNRVQITLMPDGFQ